MKKTVREKRSRRPERESDDENSDNEGNVFSLSDSIVQPTVLADEEINVRVRSLNRQQKEVFDVVHSYASRHLKNLNSTEPIQLKQLCLFITGNAGTGKSFIVRLLFDHLTKLFSFKNPMREKVLLLAPTGISSININGTTFYSALSIYPKITSRQLPQLGSQKRDELRHKFSELQAVIIDEISMVSQLSLEHINQRLNEILGSPQKKIGGLIVIVVGDFCNYLRSKVLVFFKKMI